MSVKNILKKKSAKAEIRDLWMERTPLLISLFLFAFGIGLIVDGNQIYKKQLHRSERVNYHATLNPFKTK